MAYVYFEELTIKHWMETNEIIYYKRYVDDIIIIFDQSKTTEDSITQHINSLHKFLEFKQRIEGHIAINYLDLHVHRHNNYN